MGIFGVAGIKEDEEEVADMGGDCGREAGNAWMAVSTFLTEGMNKIEQANTRGTNFSNSS